MADRDELKARVCAEIDRRASEIVAISQHIQRHPESGYREARTAEYIGTRLDKMGVKYRSGLALTGVKARLAGRRPPVDRQERVDPLSSLRKTLKQHYERKRAHYGVDRPEFYDRDLRRLFSDAPEHAHQPTAASFLVRHRREIRLLVGRWTHEYQYTIDQVLGDMIARCRELNLRLHRPFRDAKKDALVLLTVLTMNYIHGGHHRIAL